MMTNERSMILELMVMLVTRMTKGEQKLIMEACARRLAKLEAGEKGLQEGTK